VPDSTIPIENVYYLLCYAWDCLDERDITSVDVSSAPRLEDLFARVLIAGTAHVLKRGLDRSYVAFEGEVPGIRGKLVIAASVKRASFTRARAWCCFDEFSPDTLHNRILKATLRRLARVSTLAPATRESLRDLHLRLAGISDISITGGDFRRIVLGRHNAYYRFLLNVCEIIHRNLMVDEGDGQTRFRDFSRDDKQMANLFERFLFRFYEREQHRYAVSAPTLRWNAKGDESQVAYLPIMRTDIVLRTSDETVVIDAKFYSEMLAERFGKQSIKSSHLYQLFAYMEHLSLDRDHESVGGLLIYPRNGESVSIRTSLFEHPVLAATIDLAQSWEGIHRELLELLTSTLPATVAP
jgi:5-methylcytosine-specific restriction enzyme subunit McrC